MQRVEEDYGDRVNFVMVNADKADAWPFIEAFGVDAIPHMALVSAQGDVLTALIGPIPKHVLTSDLDVMIANEVASHVAESKQESLPYQMLDVFAKNPDKRRVHFDDP
jgi:thioredoxin-like negative regulator of GroEL